MLWVVSCLYFIGKFTRAPYSTADMAFLLSTNKAYVHNIKSAPDRWTGQLCLFDGVKAVQSTQSQMKASPTEVFNQWVRLPSLHDATKSWHSPWLVPQSEHSAQHMDGCTSIRPRSVISVASWIAQVYVQYTVCSVSYFQQLQRYHDIHQSLAFLLTL